MPARSKQVTNIIIVGIIASFAIFILSVIVFCNEENISVLKKNAWRVDEILLNKKSVINEFNTFNIGFLENGTILLPERYDFKSYGWPLKYSDYYFNEKEKLSGGKIIIDDTVQNIFTGEYTIEISGSNPRKLILHSESLTIMLHELRLSLENTTIFNHPREDLDSK